MATVVLLLVIALLVFQMLDRGETPFEAPDPLAANPALNGSDAPDAREMRLFFADLDGHLLDSEPRRFISSEFTVENCREALLALIEGPRAERTPVLPPTAKVRALYLLDEGELVVDLSREVALELPRSASAESLMAYGVTHTLTQPALRGSKEGLVSSVRFLIEGAPPEASFPGHGHFDFNDAVSPVHDWIASTDEPLPSDG
jgi:sporulation and spore germination protein